MELFSKKEKVKKEPKKKKPKAKSAPATPKKATPKQKYDFSKLKEGDILSCHQYMKVLEIRP